MARRASGGAYVGAAHTLLREAKTADELRQAQSVLLPLEEGLSLAQTARVIGRSIRRTCAMRRCFIQIAAGERAVPRRKHELRNRAHRTLEEESRVLDDVLATANEGGVISLPQIRPLLEKKLGRAMPLPTVYKQLARHGWRKLAPGTQHPQGDKPRREQWKKLPEQVREIASRFAAPQPLRVMFQDEARLGRISDTRYCWAKKPHHPMVTAMVTQQYTYAYGAVSPVDGRFDSSVPISVGHFAPLQLE